MALRRHELDAMYKRYAASPWAHRSDAMWTAWLWRTSWLQRIQREITVLDALAHTDGRPDAPEAKPPTEGAREWQQQ